MKTLKQVEIILVHIETIPDKLEFGKLYISVKYHCAVHLCLCGCGEKAPVPIKSYNGENGFTDGWDLTESNGKLTMSPSLAHRFNCKSHYIITNNKANFV